MGDNKSITMFVQWGQQRRPIQIKQNDDLNTIEKGIMNLYHLKQINDLNGRQIQYYDNDYEVFIDLYDDTYDSFKQILNKLFSSSPPPKSAKEWTLNIIPKTTELIHDRFPDDTYSYQQENDPTEFLQDQRKLPNPPLLSQRSRNDTPEDVPITDEPQKTIEVHDESQEFIPTNDKLPITPEHPYGLTFENPLADHQRQQFESDILRAKTAKKACIGGVLLRSTCQTDTASATSIFYPTVLFNIPVEKHCLEWSLYVYILTEADTNHTYYLHASKGIFDNCTKSEDKFGIIPSTELVNPYVIKLTPNQIRDGRFELRVKVCNVRNLSTHKRKQLNEFPRLHGQVVHNDATLLSTKTTEDLKFSSEQYHLGCILVCNQTAEDRCMSNRTIAGNHRKRTQSEQQGHTEDESEEKIKKSKPNDDNSQKETLP